MKVLAVASEIFPLVKTGGLADVTGALPLALAPLGVGSRTLVPGYPAVIERARATPRSSARYADLFGGPARLLRGRAAGLELLAARRAASLCAAGQPVCRTGRRRIGPTTPSRFAALAAVASDVATGAVADFVPDIVHAHDWQAGLDASLSALPRRHRPRPGTVMTVHNLAFQGQFPAVTAAARSGLPPERLQPMGVEYYGAIGFLKAGLALSDRITTVSPTYAAEIRTTDGRHGAGRPAARPRAGRSAASSTASTTRCGTRRTDALIARHFAATSLTERRRNKAALQTRLGLAADPDAPLFGVVSRLTWQKGLDLLLDAIAAICWSGARSSPCSAPAIRRWSAGFARPPRRIQGRVGCVIGYDEALAHLIQAGADALLVPSRFEPCGLTQLCALRYGAMPVVARVGGLADTVIDANEMALAARRRAPACNSRRSTRDALAGALPSRCRRCGATGGRGGRCSATPCCRRVAGARPAAALCRAIPGHCCRAHG